MYLSDIKKFPRGWKKERVNEGWNCDDNERFSIAAATAGFKESNFFHRNEKNIRFQKS